MEGGEIKAMQSSEKTSEVTMEKVYRQRLYEVLVFLLLIVPSMVISLFVVSQGSVGFNLTAVSVIVHDIALVSLVLFFLWHNGESFSLLGWTSKNAWKEVWIGIGLFVPVFFGAAFLDRVLQTMGFSAPQKAAPLFSPIGGWGQILLAFVMVVIVAVAEETMFRGYLILRFRGLKLGNLSAAILSAVIFSLGHGYEGASGMVTVGVLGFVFAVVYLWRESLVAPITMHFLQDFMGVVLVPLLSLK